MKVRSMVKYFAEDTVLQAIYSKVLHISQAIHHLKERVQSGDPSMVALEKLPYTSAMQCKEEKKKKLRKPAFRIGRSRSPTSTKMSTKKYVFNRNVAAALQRYPKLIMFQQFHAFKDDFQ